nr:DCC1-like thiol-disulfide oxidoreductase family protein [Pseudolabrys sp. FHR47]
MADSDEAAIGQPGGPGLVLYDGDCVLCSSWFRFVAKRDQARRLMFTTIQSEFGRAVALRLGIDPMNPQSNAVIIDGNAYLFSDSALAALSALPYWKWVWALHVVPRTLRDPIYSLVARNRYRWFGRHTQCDMGGPDYRDHVVSICTQILPSGNSKAD